MHEIQRLEVIDLTGRAYMARGVPIYTDLQDDGKTLKVFVGESARVLHQQKEQQHEKVQA